MRRRELLELVHVLVRDADDAGAPLIQGARVAYGAGVTMR
jgi:hypothetical protein